MSLRTYLLSFCLIFSLNAAHAGQDTIADYYETYKGYRKTYQTHRSVSEKTEAELAADFEQILKQQIAHASTYGLKKVSIPFDDYGQVHGSFDLEKAGAVLKDFKNYSEMILKGDKEEKLPTKKLKNEDNNNLS